MIEVLDWIADSRTKVPDCGFGELINLWDDWVLPLKGTELPLQVFTQEEVSCIWRVADAIEEFCRETSESIPDTLEILQLGAWCRVVEAAESALVAMNGEVHR